MIHREIQNDEDVGLNPTGRITTRTWSPAVLREQIKQWPTLDSDRAKLQAIRDLDESYAESVDRTTNLAVEGLFEYIAVGLDPTNSKRAETTHLALGTGTEPPEEDNTELGNEVYRTIVGDAEKDGNDLLTSTFLSQTEANGYNITEIGLCGGSTESGPLLTHALLRAGKQISKNSGMVVTIDYVIELRRA